VIVTAAAASEGIPFRWISALVGIVTVLVVVAKAARLFGATEAHLKQQDETLAAQNQTLQTQNEALADLRDKLDDLRDRHAS